MEVTTVSNWSGEKVLIMILVSQGVFQICDIQQLRL